MVWSSIISRTFGSDLLKHTLDTPLTLGGGRGHPNACRCVPSPETGASKAMLPKKTKYEPPSALSLTHFFI